MRDGATGQSNMLSETIESSRQRAAAAIQDMITKMEKITNRLLSKQESSEIKSHFLFSQSLLLTHLLLYVYSVSRHINNHANQEINKKY